MKPVLSREQCRALDAYAIQTWNVPGVLLMENAGRGAADALVRGLLPGGARDKKVLVVAGTGNNGGDGFVVARHLLRMGAMVRVWLVGTSEAVKGDARVNLEAYRSMGGHWEEQPSPGLTELAREAGAADVVVDALFGTGLDRPLSGPHLDVVRTLGEGSVPICALDLPSGLDANTGQVLGAAVRARLTVTFAAYKPGLLTPSALPYVGDVVTQDIGVPNSIIDLSGSVARLLEPEDLSTLLPVRPASTHKGGAGHVVVFAGGPGTLGAAKLAARGAHRAGAGLVTIATSAEASRALASTVVETMVHAIPEGTPEEGTRAALARKSAALVGPGLGTTPWAEAVLATLLEEARVPLVIDADALTLLSSRTGFTLPFTRDNVVLTPHPSEAARLLSVDTDSIERDRFGAARALSRMYGATVVLKGAHTLIAGRGDGGGIYVSPIACPALATAGSGDVLAGMLAAGLAVSGPTEAACLAVLAHGLAGQAWARLHGDRGLLASEIADGVPDVLARR